MKRNSIVGLMLAALMTLTVACTPATSSNAGGNSSQSASEAQVKTMKGEDLVKIIADKKQKDAVLIIDVRSADEYKAGHIQNAINISVDEMESKLSQIEDYKDKPVIVYCNTGKKSAKAADILSKNGFKDVTNAQGVKDFTGYELQTFANIRGAMFEKLIEDKTDMTVIDVRPAADLKNGFIDGSVNIPVTELEGRLSEVPKDKMVVVYCNTGTKSVEAAKILSKAGYDVTNVIEGTKEYDYKSLKKN